MTGKGVRWGRDSLGRSEPALMAASTTVLPPLTCTARGRRHLRQLLFLLRSQPTVGRSLVVRPVPGGESAGCVCLQLPCSAGFYLPACSFLPAMPTALLNILPPFSLLCALPRSFLLLFCFPLFMPCAPGSSFRASSLSGPAVCKLLELSRWQLQHGPAVAARAPVHLC